MKVVVFSSKRYERKFLSQNPSLTEKFPDVQLDYHLPRLDASTAPLAIGSDAVCIFVNDIADRKAIEILAAGGTKCILLRCAGFNQVDLKAANELGVRVLRVPAYSPYAVAEFAVALLLTTARKTHKAFNRTRESNFSLNGLMGFDVHGKTIGVCGTGKIGRLFAKIMLGFGTRVIGYDIYESQEAKDMGVEYMTFDEVLRNADVISLHCPLLAGTRHMVNEEAVGKMKKGVVLINTSRGELVDMDALLGGLRKGIIGACAMDVVEGEEALFFDDHTGEILENEKISSLLSFPNVVITPHTAFCTDTAMRNIWGTTMSNAMMYMNRSGYEKMPNEMWGKSTQYINIKNIRCLLPQKRAARMQPTSTSPPWLRLIKTCLEQDTKPSARFLQLATLTAEGHPSCRTIVFRGWYHPPPSPSHNQSYIALKAVTDIRSHKINGIRKNPWAEICWYFEQSRQQFRLTGNIRLVDFEEQDSGLIHARIDQWRALSDSARQQFCLAAPGKEIHTETSDIPSHVKLSYTDPHPSFVLMLLEPTTVDVVDLRASSRRMFLRGLQKWSDYYVNP